MFRVRFRAGLRFSLSLFLLSFSGAEDCPAEPAGSKRGREKKFRQTPFWKKRKRSDVFSHLGARETTAAQKHLASLFSSPFSLSLSLLPAPSTQNTNPSPFADGVDGRLRQAVVLGRDPDRDRLKGDPDERRRRRRGKGGSVGRVAAFVLARRRHRRLERVELGLDVVGLVTVIGLGGKKETTRRVSTSFVFIFSKPSPV